MVGLKRSWDDSCPHLHGTMARWVIEPKQKWRWRSASAGGAAAADGVEPMEVEAEEPMEVDLPPTHLIWHNVIVPGLPPARPQHRHRRTARPVPYSRPCLCLHNLEGEAIHLPSSRIACTTASPHAPCPSSPPLVQKCHLSCTESEAVGKNALRFLWAAAPGWQEKPSKGHAGHGVSRCEDKKAAQQVLEDEAVPCMAVHREKQQITQNDDADSCHKPSGLPGGSTGVQHKVHSRCLATSSSQDWATNG